MINNGGKLAFLASVAVTAMVASVMGAVAGIWLWETTRDGSGPSQQLAHGPSDAVPVTVAAEPPVTQSGVQLGAEPGSPSGALLSATLEGGRFELVGVVPDSEMASLIRERATTIYGSDTIDRLAVEPAAPRASWLDAAPDLVTVLPIISNGAIELDLETVTIRGVAGSEAKRDRFRSSVEQMVGPDIVVVDEVLVEAKPPPELVIRKSGAHVIEVTGVVPDEAVRADIEATINQSYAGYAVETDLVVDAGVEDTFALHNLPDFAELFFGFPAWELSYVNETLESSSSGSAAFESDSASVPPLGTLILDNVAARLAGTPDLVLEVAGHTDSRGGEGYNQQLSERRAQAVIDYLIETHSINPARVTAHGHGESQPIDDNGTGEGRERNRRVDFHFRSADG